MSRASVLLVEDNPRNLKLARDVLEFAGFTVIAVTTGEEALPAARRAHARTSSSWTSSCPASTGTPRWRGCAADPRTAGIPVVAVSAFAMRADRERALDAGFDGYLEKPISVRDFPDQVRARTSRGDGRRA